MRLVAALLTRQDPDTPHTPLTRVLISGIIVFGCVVYAGFFGVLGMVAVYLLGVELLGVDVRWVYAPAALALFFGLRSSLAHLVNYWRNFGHG